MITHDAIENNEYLDEMALRWLDVWSALDISYPKQAEAAFTGDKALYEAMNLDGDIPVASSLNQQNFDPRVFEKAQTGKDTAVLVRLMADRFPGKNITQSGYFYYPPGQGMSWHTNSDAPYLRCYLNYSENGDSYFKYFDQENGKPVVDQDYPGWNIRTFQISMNREDLFWHSVYSRTHRISVGFRIV